MHGDQRQRREEQGCGRWIGEWQAHRRDSQRVEIATRQYGVAACPIDTEIDLIVRAGESEILSEDDEQAQQQDESQQP